MLFDSLQQGYFKLHKGLALAELSAWTEEQQEAFLAIQQCSEIQGQP